MATVPSQQTFVAGATLTAAQLNDDLRNAVNFLLSGRPRAKAYAGADTTHNSSGSASWITVAFNSESFDNDSIHDNSTNNSRMTIQTDGLYRITGSITFAGNTTGSRAVRIFLDGSTGLDSARVQTSSALTTSVPVISYEQLEAGQYIQLQGAQNSGGNLAMNAGEFNTWLAVEWLQP